MPNAKQYARLKEKMMNNQELLVKEKERVNNAVKSKYKNDLEYRERCKQYQKDYYNRRKEQLRISEIRDNHSIE
jgi:hypothetical protein